jgi:hypothetical protein
MEETPQFLRSFICSAIHILITGLFFYSATIDACKCRRSKRVCLINTVPVSTEFRFFANKQLYLLEFPLTPQKWKLL